MKKMHIDYRKPQYAIRSVDNALRALHLLRDSGAVRIIDIAERLDVAQSTAHRIMSMLVDQGFAVQDDRQRYLAGAALSAPIVASQRNQELVRMASPILQELQSHVDEVVNLAVRLGVHTRVLTTLGDGLKGLGDRTGHVYPAHATSAGRALLATEPDRLLERLYRSRSAEDSGSALGDSDYAELRSHIEATRLHGFSVCDEEVQRSISSIAVPVVPDDSRKRCAIVLLTSAPRLERLINDREEINALVRARDALTGALQEQDRDDLA